MSARGDLILTNYSASKLIKIMPVGDSITDDCETPGAWRQYLQPLLQNAGFPFTFVGRQSSTPVGTFTKVHHEGYCGAVIAPPGYYGAHGYSDTDGNLLRIMPDSLAVTSNIPDVILLVIGTNDNGRGRDPNFVATNDMPNLLNLFFSNAPNANIILCRITSLQSANLLGYVSYATNVPTYNMALDALVNQRRALGQNVFIADMYSAVNYNNGFNSDHVHPNTIGLKAMAAEFLARMQQITQRPDMVTSTFVHAGDDWTYLDTGVDPGTNWAQFGFDDSGWSNGPARLGYGEQFDATTVNFGSDPSNKYPTTWFRHSFVVPTNVFYTNLNLRLSSADGAVVWLNGQELYRTNMPAGPISSTTHAVAPKSGFTTSVFYPTNLPATGLSPGTNLIAAEVHLSSVSNPILGFDLELIGAGTPIPPPALSAIISNNMLVVSWPATQAYSGLQLFSSTDISGGWAPSAPAQSNNGVFSVSLPADPTAPATFYRLQQP